MTKENIKRLKDWWLKEETQKQIRLVVEDEETDSECEGINSVFKELSSVIRLPNSVKNLIERRDDI